MLRRYRENNINNDRFVAPGMVRKVLENIGNLFKIIELVGNNTERENDWKT